jgi:hypothetical protein
MKIEKKATKTQPFGAHFTTKLEGVNNKLVCALSDHTTCIDDIHCHVSACDTAPI